jgi:hypothetical protein
MVVFGLSSTFRLIPTGMSWSSSIRGAPSENWHVRVAAPEERRARPERRRIRYLM